MSEMLLKAKLRDLSKKPKNLLKEGLIPAVLYGHRINNLNLAVPKKEFLKIYRLAGESSLVDLIVEDDNKKERRKVLIYEVQIHPISHEPIHIDFYQVRADEKIKTKIPLIFVGEAPAVKNLGGILVKNLPELEIEALPQNLPSHLEVDLSMLKDFDTNIYVRDLNFPTEVKVITPLETVVASVVPPSEEKEEITGPATIEEIKVEAEEKKIKEEKEKE